MLIRKCDCIHEHLDQQLSSRDADREGKKHLGTVTVRQLLVMRLLLVTGNGSTKLQESVGQRSRGGMVMQGAEGE